MDATYFVLNKHMKQNDSFHIVTVKKDDSYHKVSFVYNYDKSYGFNLSYLIANRNVLDLGTWRSNNQDLTICNYDLGIRIIFHKSYGWSEDRFVQMINSMLSSSGEIVESLTREDSLQYNIVNVKICKI